MCHEVESSWPGFDSDHAPFLSPSALLSLIFTALSNKAEKGPKSKKSAAASEMSSVSFPTAFSPSAHQTVQQHL